MDSATKTRKGYLTQPWLCYVGGNPQKFLEHFTKTEKGQDCKLYREGGMDPPTFYRYKHPTKSALKLKPEGHKEKAESTGT